MIRSILPPILCLASLAACQDRNPPADDQSRHQNETAAPAAAAAAAAASASASASSTGGVKIEEKDDLVEFSYAYPASGAAGLDRWFAAELDEDRRELRSDAAKARDEMRGQGFPYRTYSLVVEWRQVGRSAELIALRRERYAYTGGAHGNTDSKGVLWNRARDRELDMDDILLSEDAFHRSLREPVCTALAARKRERQIAPTNACPDMDDLTFIPTGPMDAAFDHILAIADPYVVGAYAEGTYEMRVPVTPAVLDTIEPAWRASFSVPR